MKILVLGNGFDIDHNLPTSYMDFLNFCNYVLDMDNPESPYRAKLSDFQLEYIKILEQHNEIRETFLMFLKNNRFLLYFNNRINKQGNDWIDFEREIKGVVNEFKSIELELKESNQYHYCTDDDHKIYQVIKDLNYTFITRNFWDEIVLTEIHDELCMDLNNFAHALEYYVAHFINATPIKGVSPDIIDFDATKIITFNYSDTYERNYGGIRWDESVDHVHGTAIGDLNKESNIILGITSENMQSSYVEFEKYFQRITKKTGNEYKNWLQSRLGKKENIEVMFFGHSLDSADSDIVKDLILNENSKIKIYYHSEAAHQQIVANLIDIIGKEALLKFVSGKEPKICFQKQRKHEDFNTAGVEITRDIRSIYKMHTMTKTQIETLLSKIRTKISNAETTYFYSQRKTISLFEALKQYAISGFETKEFFNICNQLPYERLKNGNLKFYQDEEWFDCAPWGEEIPCSKSTIKLINAINKSNNTKFQKDEDEKIYTKVLKLKTSEEMKDCLLQIFLEEHPSKEYWHELGKLIGFVLENENFIEALKLLQKENMPLEVKVKAKHFSDMYDEQYFHYQYNKQMAENYQPNEDEI